jgi:hypothetical protein
MDSGCSLSQTNPQEQSKPSRSKDGATTPGSPHYQLPLNGQYGGTGSPPLSNRLGHQIFPGCSLVVCASHLSYLLTRIDGLNSTHFALLNLQSYKEGTSHYSMNGVSPVPACGGLPSLRVDYGGPPGNRMVSTNLPCQASARNFFF